jgi:UDP-N-acetylglucosamine 2-epimerase (non-hydrolysing)
MKVLGVATSYTALEMLAQICADLRQHKHSVLLVYADLHHDVPTVEHVLTQIDMQLDLGTGSPIAQTGQAMIQLEAVMLREKPDWLLVAGDNPIATAAALSAAKIHVKVARLGAGERSFDRTQQEELNRQFADHLCDIWWVSTPDALENLQCEGITQHVYRTGDSRSTSLLTILETQFT